LLENLFSPNNKEDMTYKNKEIDLFEKTEMSNKDFD